MSDLKGFNMDIYFREEYAKIYELNGEGKTTIFTWEGELGKVRYIFLKREINLLKEKYYDIITPYGYGGPQFFPKEHKNLRDLIFKFKEHFEDYCSKNRIISEFIRFHPLLKNHSLMEIYMNIINIGDTINLFLSSEDDIMLNMKKSSRYSIRKAVEKGMKVERDNSDKSWNNFIDLYYQTMNRNQAKEYYYFSKTYFGNIRSLLKERAQIFNVVYENKVISSMLVLVGEQFIHSHLLGIASEYRKERFGRFFDYNIALWGLRRGCKHYHLGGGYGGREDSIFKYKKSLAKNGRLSFYVGNKVHNKKVYDELSKIHEKNNPEVTGKNLDYFPLYRR
jgi:hypothetical protein